VQDDYTGRLVAYVALAFGALLLLAGLALNPHIAAWSVLPLLLGVWMLARS
jgi:hypothetical protein